MSETGIRAVGFIGIGVMGTSMAGHLAAAGYQLHVYSRTKSKAEGLLEKGAQWYDSPASLAASCDAVITMVGFPQDVENIYFGEDGLLAHARSGAYLIDMTTSSPLLATRIYEAAAERGMFSLDAPVSGGDIGAKERRLSIMVGGDDEAYKSVLPLFEQMGTNIVLQGKAGAGQHTKMCNQIAIASNMLGVCEAIAYAQASGLDPDKVLTSIATGAAGSWSLSNLAPRMIAGNMAPGFYVKHFIKDMGIAIDSAKQMGVELPGLNLAESMYRKLAELGYGDNGTQALIKLWDRSAVAE
ncbi:NAD(P)-dependent oxidoreductase [Paenibacillus sp. strain BS8-2]